MILRYLLGLGAATLLVLLSLFLGGFMEVYGDFPTLVLVIGLPILVSLGIWGPGAMGKAIKTPFQESPEPKSVQTAIAFWKSQSRLSIATGILLVIQGMVGMLVNLADKSQVGPALAMSLLSLYYTAILNLLVFLPLRIMSERKKGG